MGQEPNRFGSLRPLGGPQLGWRVPYPVGYERSNPMFWRTQSLRRVASSWLVVGWYAPRFEVQLSPTLSEVFPPRKEVDHGGIRGADSGMAPSNGRGRRTVVCSDLGEVGSCVAGGRMRYTLGMSDTLREAKETGTHSEFPNHLLIR